jgi:hypothetical protein
MDKLRKNFSLDNLTPEELENIKGGCQVDPCPIDDLIAIFNPTIGIVKVPSHKTTVINK